MQQFYYDFIVYNIQQICSFLSQKSTSSSASIIIRAIFQRNAHDADRHMANNLHIIGL